MKALRLQVTQAAMGDRFKQFQRIAVDWDGKWWLATIKKINKDGSCDVQYDSDGSEDTYDESYMLSDGVMVVPANTSKSDKHLTKTVVRQLHDKELKTYLPLQVNLITDLPEGWCAVMVQTDRPDYAKAGPFKTKKEADKACATAEAEKSAGSSVKFKVAYGRVSAQFHVKNFFHPLTPP